MKYPIKMIVVDLDGTLLRSDETISEYTKNTLNQCRRIGIKVAFATGRGERSAKNVAPYKYFDGAILQCGAVISIGEDIVSKNIIPYEMARPLLMFFDKNGLNTMSEDNKLYYTNFEITNGWTSRTNYRIVDFSTHNVDAEKMHVFYNAPEEIEFVELNLPSDFYCVTARGGHVMIMRKDSTKLKGIMKLSDIWGVDRSEIVSFGDDMIDIEMLMSTGIGVAMENAVLEVKAAVDYICDTNDNDGVAKWLEEHVL